MKGLKEIRNKRKLRKKKFYRTWVERGTQIHYITEKPRYEDYEYNENRILRELEKKKIFRKNKYANLILYFYAKMQYEEQQTFVQCLIFANGQLDLSEMELSEINETKMRTEVALATMGYLHDRMMYYRMLCIKKLNKIERVLFYFTEQSTINVNLFENEDKIAIPVPSLLDHRKEEEREFIKSYADLQDACLDFYEHQERFKRFFRKEDNIKPYIRE